MPTRKRTWSPEARLQGLSQIYRLVTAAPYCPPFVLDLSSFSLFLIAMASNLIAMTSNLLSRWTRTLVLCIALRGPGLITSRLQETGQQTLYTVSVRIVCLCSVAICWVWAVWSFPCLQKPCSLDKKWSYQDGKSMVWAIQSGHCPCPMRSRAPNAKWPAQGVFWPEQPRKQNQEWPSAALWLDQLQWFQSHCAKCAWRWCRNTSAWATRQ